jgi:hypothetical protein
MPKRNRSASLRAHRHPLRFELLEDRTAPAAANVFSQFAGVLAAPNASNTVRVHLGPEDFTLGSPHVTIGFVVTPAAGSGLAPKPVTVTSVSPGNVPTIDTETGLPGGASLTLAKLKYGDYDLAVGGLNGTTGAWRLEVFLAGDANGDLAVTDADISLLQGALGSTTLDPGFPAEGDSNRDGMITGYDLARAQGNQGTSTPLRLLTVTTALSPASDTGVPGDNLVNTPSVQLVGQTRPGAQLALDRDGNGFDDGTATAGADGGYTLPAALAEGANVLRVRARDAFGQEVITSTTVTLDTHLTTPAFDLSLGSDTGTVGDQTTSAGTVTLVGVTDPGETVTLRKGGVTIATALASSGGTFQFANVPLAPGANGFTARVADAAGNVRTFDATLTRVAADPNQQDVALRWTRATLDAIRLDASAPPAAARALAMVSTAVFDAVSAIEGTPGYLVKLTPPAGASAEAAAAAAGHDVLSYLYPAQQATFDATLAASLAQVPAGASQTAGVAFGQSVGDAVIAQRAGDGALDATDYVPADANPGTWRPTPPMYAEALLPQFATVRPFALSSPGQFRPPAPPALGSTAYAAALNEVEAKGRATGSTRTADETQSALFWADGLGTVTPAGHWDLIALQLAQAQGNSLSANARLFAELNVALADAAITAWDAKYFYGLWRPITAIQQAGADGNPQTTPDAAWTPLLVTPNFPTYVSGHSTFSGAAQVVLESFFGNGVGFTATSEAPGIAARTFTSFAQAAEEAGQSRILGGIHFQFDNQAGLTAGRSVGGYVLQAFSLAADTRAPTVAIRSPAADLVSPLNITVSGQVLDNLSGVKSLEVQIDGGNYVAATFDAAGNFDVATSFALDGSADGTHTLRFRATDYAGNVAAPVTYTFTLDRVPPTLSLTAPTGVEPVIPTSRLTGTASGTGSAVTALSYAFDGGPSQSVAFDPATGAFDQPLDLSALAAGSHTLAVTARDAAGHSTTTTRSVTLLTAIPLTVTDVSPAAGATDVGPTQRPQVTFSRPVDPTSLTGNNFYATDTTGAKLPANIVVRDDNTAAWLFFTTPMPGASTITVTVDGSSIRAADGSALDAAGDGTPGSTLTFSFTTVSLAGLPGTSLTGVLVDPGPDLKPNTTDDVRRGPDGVLMTGDDVYLNPIANVRVYILGLEGQAVFTDAQGRFTLPSVPSGDVKLVLDGRTATNAPTGCYFPEMVMDLTIEPGKVNTVMGSMGTREQAAASEVIQGVYLPRLKSAILQPVSDTQPTTVTVAPDAAPDLTAAQRQLLTAEVQPGTAVGADGHVMSGVQVGISTVPPELIREMLPPGVSEPPFTITVQAPGVVNFTTPVEVSYPNVDSAAAGTKMLFISFDHATGRLVFDGTATVSADGKSVVTDPGDGITHPGWHFVISGTTARTPIGKSATNQCGGGPDFTYNDNPPISLGASALILSYQALKIAQDPILFAISPETMYKADMLAALALLGGGPGIDAFTHFIGGSGTEVVHGAGTVLGDLAKNSNSVKGFITDVNKQIHDNLQAQANSGPVVDNRNVTITTPNISFSFSENEGIYIGFLKSVIGGTQGNDVKMENFSATINSYSQDAGGSATYSYKLHIEICDDFGVDESDLTGKWYYNQPFNPLIPFWLLQHRTSGPRPFVNRIVIDTDTITGTINIPAGYEDADVQIDPLSTSPGFGADPSVYYRYVVDTGLEITGKFHPDSPPPDVILPPNRYFRVEFYQPSTNRSAVIASTSGSSGETTVFAGAPLTTGPAAAMINLDTFGGPDLDGDGIPDVGEFVLGTNPRKTDSDGDGISDSAELEQGLDPLNGRAFPTGVIATLPLQAAPERLAVEGDRIYAATGGFGLAVIDGTRFDGPVVLGQLDLPGTATDVGVDGRLGLAAVATGSALQLVDVSDGTQPRLVESVDVPATRVLVANGLAYAASGNQLRVVDLASGTVVQSLTLPGSGTLTGFAREGTFLYAFVSGSDTFSVIDIANEGAAVVRGQLFVSVASSDVGLFVGNGVAWLAGSGLRTIDVSNPASPQVIQVPSGSGFFTARRIALNGSGLGLLLPDGGNFLQVYDTSNPANVANLLLQLNLTGTARDIAVSRGIAYVATGSGLEVVNYLPFDSQGVPPTVAVSTPAADVDLIQPGLQVLEGTSLPVRVNVTDDRQVRDVELLVNGEVVAKDVSFPFDFFALAPQAAPGATSFTLQVRATDTGGNVALSNLLTIGLVTDSSPPTITAFVPPSNSSQVEPIQVVQVRFSKPMDAESVTAATVRVRDGAGTFLTPATFQLRDDGRLAQLTFAPLLLGSYQIVVSGGVTDRAGNTLSATDVISPFTLTPRATLATTAADADPAAPGLQVFEGATVPLTVSVVAGVSVQKVELLVNGEIVASDTTAPYTFSAIAPIIAPGTTAFTLQAKVTDTSGVATFTSPLLSVGLVEDVTPPTITGTNPSNGGVAFKGLTTVQVTFSEPVAVATAVPANFQLFEAGPGGVFGDGNDVAIPITAAGTTADDTVIQLTVAALNPGTYELLVTKDAVTDRAGNPVGTGVFSSTFTVQDRPGLSDLLNLHGTPITGSVTLMSDKLTMAINPGGSLIVGGTGLVFDGKEFVIWGAPVWNYSITYNGTIFADGSGFTSVTREDLSSGSFHGYRFAGTAGSVRMERVIAFNDGDQFAVIVTRLTNLTGAALSNTASMENTDPDQGIPINGSFETFNDVVLGGHFVRADATSAQYPDGLTLGFGSADPRAVTSAEGFSNIRPYDIINSPEDPDGALDDIGINLAVDYGTVPAFGVVVSGMVVALGKSTTEAEQVYQQAAPITTGGGQPQLAAEPSEVPGPTTPILSQEQLQPVVARAIEGLSAAGYDTSGLRGVQVQVVDLPGSLLGWTYQNTIWIDPTAAGSGWFTDASPGSDAAFVQATGASEFRAAPGSPAYGRFDLLTVVTHELGHVLGLASITPGVLGHDWMTATLGTGVRRYPDAAPQGEPSSAPEASAAPTADSPRTGGIGADPTPRPADLAPPVAATDPAAPDHADILPPRVSPIPSNPVDAPATLLTGPGLGVAGTEPANAVFSPPLPGTDPVLVVGGPPVDDAPPKPGRRVEEWLVPGPTPVFAITRGDESADASEAAGGRLWLDAEVWDGLPLARERPVNLP